MDQHSSPYLEAIQSVAGCTPGQKYKELNLIARRAAAGAGSHGDAAESRVNIGNVPEALVPLVRVEIAKILRQNEVVIEALRSDDCEVVDRAMRVNWFFRADNSEVINVDYFKTALFPCVSLNTRIKLIKRLTLSFGECGETKLAEQFYDYICQSYGRSQAEPLLVACGESFIWETINEQKIILSRRMIKTLFVRYPKLIVRYLKLSAPCDEARKSRDTHKIDIHKYSEFLPRLIKNHLRSLIELIEMRNSCLGIHLSKKATERFLKSNVDVVLQNPNLYTNMMPLKVIAAKLTKSQYRSMFARVYPRESKDFQYYQVEDYLKYYPEQERLTLLLETYEKLYNSSMLDKHDLINENIMKMLPVKERERQALVKLEKEPDWRENRWNVERIWRCYLPIRETIASIKTEISKTSSTEDRSVLLQQMFFTCRLNDDKDTLLEVLRYFTTRHRNEQTNTIFEALNSLVQQFDMMTFGEDLWSVINEFMKFLHVKDELAQRSSTLRAILASSIHFGLTHDRAIDESIEILIEVLIRGWNVSWCVLEKYPEYDRACFDRMMSILPQKYPEDHKIWANCRLDALRNIVKSMLDFNNRNDGRAPNSKMEKLSIKNYPWLLEAVKKILETGESKELRKLDCVREYLRIWEPDLYEQWIPAKPEVIEDVKTGEALKFLKKDPKKILDRCDDYLKVIKEYVGSNTTTQRFVKACRWCQHIPIKFLADCLENMSNETNADCLLILGILMEGPVFARVIEPLVPKEASSGSIDTTGESAKSTYRVIYAIPRAMNLVNPPVPLSLVMSFCQGEYLNLGLISLTNACRRISVEKIEKFTKTLTDSRVSVKKHGIRLYCLVATIADYREFLACLWKTEKHRSIRAVVFGKIHELFINKACNENWILMKDCMADLSIDDDDNLDSIVNLNGVADSYIADYVPHLLDTLERLQAEGFNSNRVAKYISAVLSSIDESVSELLPEEFSERVLRKYFCNTSLAIDVGDFGMRYALYGYLRGNETKFDDRLLVFGKLYVDILMNGWNVADSLVPTYCPVNWMTQRFVNDHIFPWGVDEKNVKIMETILKSFLTVLEPQDDWFTYAVLTYGIALRGAKETSAIAEKITETLSHLVETLSPILVIELANVVTKWLEILVDAGLLDSLKYEVIETLCRNDTVHSCALAAKLLFRSSDRKYDERRNKIVELLRKSEYPVVVSLACRHVNTCDSLK